MGVVSGEWGTNVDTDSLNIQRGYIKIDANLLNHLPYDFWHQIVIMLSSYKSWIKICSLHSNYSENNLRAPQ